MSYHLFGHMDRNFVKRGDKVVAYKTLIGTLGDGNSSTSFNKMAAHLHYSETETQTPEQQKSYVTGKGKKFVEENYIKPKVDFDRMFDRKMDVGKKGYGFLDKVIGSVNTYHPGVDVNGANTSGNQDFGWQFTSPVSGTVVYEWRGWTSNGGWGNLIIIKEEQEVECSKCCKKHCGI